MVSVPENQQALGVQSDEAKQMLRFFSALRRDIGWEPLDI
jgi:hypothetical protein